MVNRIIQRPPVRPIAKPVAKPIPKAPALSIHKPMIDSSRLYDVAVYFSSANLNDPRKNSSLESFSEGAKKLGLLVGDVYNQRQLVKSRLAIILGWHSPYSKKSILNDTRKNIIDFQKNTGGKIMPIDAGCWKYCDSKNEYLRYSLDGVFYDQSNYANKNSTPDRYNIIKTKLNIDLLPWKKEGEHILLLMQRDAGWSMKGLKPLNWVAQKVEEIRKHSNRKIVVRPHPVGTKSDELASLKTMRGVEVTDYTNTSIRDDLKNCYAAVVFNSSSGVAAIMEGVPLFVDDKSSVCYSVSNTDINLINTPIYPEREQWLYDLAACHWSDDDARNGLIYKKFEQFLKP